MSKKDTSFTFVKLTNKFYLNRKIQKFAVKNYRAAFLWVNALTYCADNLTDGYFDEWDNSQYLHISQDDLESLVNAGLLEREGDGYVIHDYMDFQNTKSEIERIRHARAEAGRKGGKQVLKQTEEASAQANDEANAQALASSKSQANKNKRHIGRKVLLLRVV